LRLIAVNDTDTFRTTFLDEGSAHRTHICLSTHNIYRRQTSVPLAVFERAIPSSEWRQTHAFVTVFLSINTFLGETQSLLLLK